MTANTTADAGMPRRRHPAPPHPDDGFRWHGDRDEVEAGGIVIPGLRASFYRRPAAGGRVETLGLYAGGRRLLFAAWGFVDERHCRYNAVRAAAGGWHDTRRGCPVLEPILQGAAVVGFTALAGRVRVPFRLADPATLPDTVGGPGDPGRSAEDGGSAPAAIMAAWNAR